MSPKQPLESAPIHGKKVFLPPIVGLKIRYDVPRMGAGGDSKGMVEFLTKNLKWIAQDRPYVSFEVIRERGAPQLIAEYSTGAREILEVKRQSAQEIKKKVLELLDARGGRYVSGTRVVQPVRPLPGIVPSQGSLPPWDPLRAPTLFKP
jgi:hypothetical protein